MEYEPKTFFKEHEQDDVKGFTILSHCDDGESYHIGEKWLKEEGDDIWVQYEIPESQLLKRVSDDKCEPVGQLTDEQYQKVVEFVKFKMPNTEGAEV